MKKIFLLAGEPSGDVLGGRLMAALKAQSSGALAFVGIGGEHMEAEGLESMIPMEELSVMGIWEVIWQLPRLLKLINGVVEEIEREQPDTVITIDAQDFSYQVASRLKKRGHFKGKIVHYVAPTVWAWRPGRAKKLPQVYDALMCLFPFEPDYFTPHGLNATYVGHPLVGYNLDQADGAAFRQQSGIGPEEKVLGLFFGSREEEIKTMATPIMETVAIIKEKYPDIQIVIPTLSKLEFNIMEIVRAWDCEATIVAKADLKWDAFAACDAALAVSGTVGLELAYMGVPHVIAYKTHPLTWAVVRYMAKVRFAHLANILLDRAVVPEYLQLGCESTKISRGVLKLLKDDDARQAQMESFTQLRALLGAEDEKTPSEKAAAFVLYRI